MRLSIKIILLGLLLTLPLHGQDRGVFLREDVSYLADSLRAGRGFGKAGNQAAAFYLLRQMRGAGLRTTVQAFRHATGAGHNVYGVTPGWFRRYIVVGAYFDGLGKPAGEYYPGADSNASGVAAMLALARELGSQCNGDTGLIFVAFDGHSASMSGAQEFCSMIRRQYNVSMMVNLDILGSTKAPIHKNRPDYLIALGGSSYRFGIENANRTLGLDLSYDYYGSRNFTDLFYRKISDQKWFLESGVPSLMFTSGITMDTNKVTDTVDELDFEVFGKRVELIMKWLRMQL